MRACRILPRSFGSYWTDVCMLQIFRNRVVVQHVKISELSASCFNLYKNRNVMLARRKSCVMNLCCISAEEDKKKKIALFSALEWNLTYVEQNEYKMPCCSGFRHTLWFCGHVCKMIIIQKVTIYFSNRWTPKLDRVRRLIFITCHNKTYYKCFEFKKILLDLSRRLVEFYRLRHAS